MTVNTYLKHSLNLLISYGIPTPRLDSLILIEFVLGVDRAKLLAEPDLEISVGHINVLDSLIDKRCQHIPIAQLVGKTEFYGRNFIINSSVLEPRPESETMIDMLIELVKTDKYLSHQYLSSKASNQDQTINIADIGCGALGISAKLELGNVIVDLIDIDIKALIVAKNNVALHTIDISVIQNDLLVGLDAKYDILMCNLPYVPDDFKINLAASHEPEIAIFGGPDGLDIYRRLFDSLHKIHHQPLFILSEVLPTSHSELEKIAGRSNYVLSKTDDFIQLFKYSESTNI